jgi:hypothetical protein
VNAAHLGIECSKVEGLWPQVASETPDADVVVCHHVVYNVSDLASFVAALTRSPRRRVVVEVTAVHHMSWMAPYWEAIHGLPQPHEPIVQDVIAVLIELGLNVRQQRWNRPYQMIGETGEDSRSRIGAHPDGGTHEGAPEWVTRSRGERCRTRLPAPRYSAISRNRRARIGVRKRASLPPMDVRPTAG